MNLKTLMIAAASVALMTTQSFAICYERTQDVGDVVVPDFGNVTRIVGSNGGQSGAGDYRGATTPGCANGTVDEAMQRPGGFCQLARNLQTSAVGGAAPIPKTTYEQVGSHLEDIFEDQYRIGFYLGQTWVGTNWKAGSCDF